MTPINKKNKRQQQGKIEDGEEMYCDIFEQSPETIVVHDGEILRLINPAGVKMLGAASAEELIGKPLTDFVRPADQARIKTRFEQQQAGKSLPLTIEKLIRPDGTILDVEVATISYHYQGTPASLLFMRDVTERKQIEQELRESESGLRQAQHFAHMGSWTWNMQTNRLDWSDEMYVIFGVEKEIFSGALSDVIAQAIHPDDRAKVEQSNLNVMRGGKPETLEYRIVWQDGSVHVIRAEAAEMIRDQTGAPAFLRGTAQEITERMQAEEALRESDARYRTVISNAPVITFATDEKGIFTLSEGKGLAKLGLQPGQVVGLSVFDMYRDYPTITDALKNAFAGYSQRKEVEVQGSVFDILFTPVLDQHGKVLKVIGVANDITERKQAEDALKRSEALYQNLVETSQDLIWQCDTEGRYTYLNPAWERVFGYTVEEMLAKKFTDFQTPEMAARDQKEFAHLMQGNTVNSWETIHIGKLGNEINLVFNAKFLVDENGQIRGTQGTAYDVTARKRAEGALRESEQRYKMVSELASDYVYKVGIAADGTASLDFVTDRFYPVTKRSLEDARTVELWNEIVHPDDLGKFWEFFHRLITTRQAGQLECRAYTGDNCLRWLEIFARPEWDEQENRVTAIVGAIKDITERKQAEEALRESEQRYRMITELASDYVYKVGIAADGTISLDFVTDSFYKITGRSPQDARTVESWSKIIHPDDLGKFREFLQRMITTRQAGALECRSYTADKRGRWVELIARPEWDAQENRVTAIVGAVKDITARKQAEEALRESEENYRQLFENMNDAFALHRIILDESGKPIDYQFLNANPVFTQRLGIKPEDLIGHAALELFPETEQYWIDIFGKVALDGQPAQYTNYSIELNRYYETRIYCPRPGYFAALFSDITERKRAEDALRESEENYRRLFDNAILGIFQSTPEGKLISANQAFARMFGYASPQDATEHIKNVASSVFADPSRRAEILRQMAENPDLRTFENVYRRKNGSTFIGHLHTTPVHDATGRLIRMEGIIEDITERKRTEAVLQETRSFLQQIVDTSPNMIFVVNEQGKLLFTNQYTATYYGTSPEQLVLKATQIVHDNQAEAQAFIDDNQEVIRTRQKIVREELNTAPNGEQHWFYTIKVPLLRPDGTVDVLGIATDITERKQAEETLRHSEKRFRALIENSWDALLLVNVENKIVYYSPSSEHVTGYTSEDVLGRQTRDFVHPDHTEAAARLRATLREPGAAISAEYRIRHKNGAWIWVESVIHNLLAEPSVQAVVINMRDVTERREAEEKLRESEDRFRSLSQATFEGIMIHDQGVIQDANQVFAELCGYSKPEDLIGKNSLEVIPFTPESLECVKASIQTGSTETLEICIARPDGAMFPAETQAREITFKGRKLRVVTMRDITKRKEAERMQARMTAMLEATPDFVSIADPGQHITYINRAGRRMVGIGEDEDISGLKIRDLSPEWANLIIEKVGIPTAIRDGVWGGETACLTRDGREIPVAQVILAHKGTDGTLEYLSSISRDVTASKRAEEKIRQQLAHLTALSEIDRAIASSFDLKESLTTLLGHVTRQLNVDAADALLFDADTRTLKYIAGNGFRSQWIESFSMPLNRGYTGSVFLERRAIHVPDLREKPEKFIRTDLLAEDHFITYFGVPLIAKEEVKGVLEIFHRARLEPDEEWLDFLHALAEQAAIAVDNAILFSDLHNSKIKLEQAYDTTLDGWSKALDLRDRETEGHTRRVTELTLQVARKLGLANEELVQIRRGGLLHDIGKMGIPDAILLKPGTLTDEEWVIMRKHPAYAYEMLSPIEYLHPALDIPYCHHEKWDGSGYPRGLKGEDIPLGARIFCIADVWDALNSDRPYRKAWEKGRVLEYIRSLNGTHFDPAVVNAFLEMTEQNGNGSHEHHRLG